MRVNIYAEEMTDRIEIIEKEIEGHKFTALRFYLYLSVTQITMIDGQPKSRNIQGPFIHREGDDDSTAVTFWGKQDLRVMLKQAIEMLDRHYEGKSDKPKE